jgi:esterase/lipase superfamily enzyme
MPHEAASFSNSPSDFLVTYADQARIDRINNQTIVFGITRGAEIQPRVGKLFIRLENQRARTEIHTTRTSHDSSRFERFYLTEEQFRRIEEKAGVLYLTIEIADR